MPTKAELNVLADRVAIAMIAAAELGMNRNPGVTGQLQVMQHAANCATVLTALRAFAISQEKKDGC